MSRRVALGVISVLPSLPPVTKRAGLRALLAGCPGRVARILMLLMPLAFLTSGGAQSQSTVSLFTNTAPTVPVAPTTHGITLGLKFSSSQAGTVSAIRFYRAAKSLHGYVATLYSANGSTVLGSVKMTTESGAVPGWQQAVFATPISIAANTTYVAAYYAPNGQYAETPYGLTNTVSSSPLNASGSSLVGGNGVYFKGSGFPTTTWESANFFVDVVFTPTAPVLQINLTPANPTISAGAALGSTVATINTTWSDGSPFTGTLGFGPPNNNGGGVYAISGNKLIISTTGPGVGASGGSVQNVTIVATQ